MGNIYRSKKKTGETSSEYRDRVAKEGAEWHAAGPGQRSHLAVPDSEKVQNNKPTERSTSFQDYFISNRQTKNPSPNNYTTAFMAKNPINKRVPNCIPRGKGKDKLSKPADDPCWKNYVQRGMKNK